MGRFLPVLEVILVIWAISDCLSRRENRFWILVVLIFPIGGALLYFAWTRNWLGRVSLATAGRGARSDWDVVGEGTPAAMQRRGSALYRRGHHKEAVEVLEDLLSREGPNVPAEARYDIAMAYKALGRYRDARDQLSLIVGDEPKFHGGEAFFELADCYEQMKDDAKAQDLYQQLLRQINLPQARYRYGVLLDRLGHKTVAVEQMKALLDDLEKSPEFHRRNNRRYAKLAKEYLRGAEG